MTAFLKKHITLKNLKYLGQQLLLALLMLYLVALPFILWFKKYPFGWTPHKVVRFLVTAYLYVLLWGCMVMILLGVDLILYDYWVLGKVSIGSSASRVSFHVGDSLIYDLFGAFVWIGSSFVASYAIARTFIAAYPKWATPWMGAYLFILVVYYRCIQANAFLPESLPHLGRELAFCSVFIFASFYGAVLGEKKKLAKGKVSVVIE